MDTNMHSVVVGGWVLTPDPGLRGVNAGRGFELAEELRRFAEAQSYRAMVILHDDAQRKTPAHLEALESGPGMGISARSGNLVTRPGFTAAVTQIALTRAVPSEVAQQSLNHAEVLSTDLPETLHALTQGTVDPSHVAVIAEQVLRIVPRPIPVPESKDPAAREEWMRRVDAEERAVHAGRNELGGRLLDYAAGRSPASVRQKGKALLEKYDPVSFGKRSKKAQDDRWVRVEPGNNGMAYLTAALTSATAEAIYDRLDRQAKTLKDTLADPDGAPEERTMDQLRTDALTDQLLAGPAGSGLENVQAHVSITVPATLLPALARAGATPPPATQPPPAAGRPPATDGGPAAAGPPAADLVPARDIPPGAELPTAARLGALDLESTAALLAAAPSWWRVLTDPYDGAIIDWAHNRYTPTPAQRRALTQRDHTCRTPGCHRRAARCEPDHTIEWQHGGTTNLNNLAMLCKRCHRLKSLGILTMDQHPDGTITTTTLWNTTHESAPDAPWATTRPTTGTGTEPRTQEADTQEPDTDTPEPWDDPPPPEVVERRNAVLFADAAHDPDTPPADPAADAQDAIASWQAIQQHRQRLGHQAAEREKDNHAWETAGGYDLPLLLELIGMTDHTPAQNPDNPPRPYPRIPEPRRPRIRQMRPRNALPGNHPPDPPPQKRPTPKTIPPTNPNDPPPF